MLQNEYLVAIVAVHIAENEPSKVYLYLSTYFVKRFGPCRRWPRRWSPPRLRGAPVPRPAPRRLAPGTKPFCTRETNEKMKWKMKISHKFWKFLAFSEFFSHFFSKYPDSLSFPEHFCEIPENFHQIFAEISQNSLKNENEKWNFIFIPAKFGRFFAEILRSERCKGMQIL